jgi:hypothetical protein
MAEIRNRQDPVENWSVEYKNKLLTEVEKWLTQSWLEQEAEHPIRHLWRRRDFLSTVELLTLGFALERTKDKASKRMLSDIADDIRSNDNGNAVGSAFEILAASIFDTGKQQITFPKNNQPGYDFAINLSNQKKIRVSCKALISSLRELEFRRFSENIYKSFIVHAANQSKPFQLLGVLSDKNETNIFNRDEILKQIYQNFDRWNGITNLKIKVCGWNFYFSKIDDSLKESRIGNDREYLSHTFVMTSDFLGNEQRRFCSKVEQGFENLKKHCSEVDISKINFLIIKVPNSISIAQAKIWLSDYFESNDNKHISAVLVYRTSVVSSIETGSSYVNYEFTLIDNPNASIDVVDFLPRGIQTLEGKVPIGNLGITEPVTALCMGQGIFDASKAYSFLRFHHQRSFIYPPL